MERSSDNRIWRVVYAFALVLVLAGFLFSLRQVLNPFLLGLLFVLLAVPFTAARGHAPLVAAVGVLTLIWLVETIGFLLTPFLLALAFAYILHPPVSRLEKRRIPRSVAIGLLALPLVIGLVILVIVGVPALSAQLARFFENLPTLLRTAAAHLEELTRSLASRDFPLLNEEAVLARLREFDPNVIVSYVQSRREAIAGWAWHGVLGAGRGIGSALSIAGYIVLTPILTFYILRDWEAIVAHLAELPPARQRARIVGFIREYDLLLSRYFRGQLLEAAIVGVLTGVGFWLLGFPYALLLGVVAGMFNVVPYLGLIVSLIPALVIAFFSGAIIASLGKIALVFVVVQTLDSSVIGPRVVGESVGLHPVWVILALSVSALFFGFVGLLIAIPLAVLVKLMVVAALRRYRRSSLFTGSAA